MKQFKDEGIKGLEERRGKAKGPGLSNRTKTKTENPETRIRSKNEMLKTVLRIEEHGFCCKVF
ncbi:hypothetical protein P4J22_28120 [Bacillus cereus]|nr:hypothetical protein [Bacillus cereus]